jgi:hypothetical protein
MSRKKILLTEGSELLNHAGMRGMAGVSWRLHTTEYENSGIDLDGDFRISDCGDHIELCLRASSEEKLDMVIYKMNKLIAAATDVREALTSARSIMQISDKKIAKNAKKERRRRKARAKAAKASS